LPEIGTCLVHRGRRGRRARDDGVPARLPAWSVRDLPGV